MDNGVPIDIVFTDLSKAFDTVSHEQLPHKLQAYRIGGKLLDLIRDWLTKRVQRVVLGDHTGDWKSVLSCVPQGSVLDSLLFLFFINDITDKLHFSMQMIRAHT